MQRKSEEIWAVIPLSAADYQFSDSLLGDHGIRTGAGYVVTDFKAFRRG